MTIQRELALFAAKSSPPEGVLPPIKLRLLDTLAAGLVNARADYADKLIAAYPDERGPATVWGRPERMLPIRAAFVNGSLAHGSDFDDTQGESGAHVSSVVVAAALTCAEEVEATASQLLTALAVGTEISVRIAAAGGHRFAARGFHATPVVGVYGATAACGRLLRLESGSMSDAIGLAASFSSGLLQFLESGGDAKRLHAGWAAHAGYQAARWAAAGISGSEDVVEGRYGLFRTFLGQDVEVGRILDGLGEEWQATRVMAKRYPCCHYLQALIDAASELGATVAVDQIVKIIAFIPKQGMGVVCEPEEVKRAPIEPYAAKFSAYYVLASALIDRTVGLETFSAVALSRPQVHQLIERIECRPHDFGLELDHFTYPAGLEIHLRDGQVLRCLLNEPRELDSEGVKAKLRICASTADVQAEAILAAVESEVSALNLLETLCA